MLWVTYPYYIPLKIFLILSKADCPYKQSQSQWFKFSWFIGNIFRWRGAPVQTGSILLGMVWSPPEKVLAFAPMSVNGPSLVGHRPLCNRVVPQRTDDCERQWPQVCKHTCVQQWLRRHLGEESGFSWSWSPAGPVASLSRAVDILGSRALLAWFFYRSST